ncbi:hypothetical protein ACS0TY_000578 [Phlomoides rotata]
MLAILTSSNDKHIEAKDDTICMSTTMKRMSRSSFSFFQNSRKIRKEWLKHT